jgi:hypothetical protein
MKKNYDYWRSFTSTGRIDDYLNYIACTREDSTDEFLRNSDEDKEGGLIAGINYSNGDGSIGHASW